MKTLFSDEDIVKLKSTSLIPFECEFCCKIFHRFKYVFDAHKRGKRNPINFCSKSCQMFDSHKDKGNSAAQKVFCLHCGEIFTKTNANIKRRKNHFCSHSCAATFNNKNKTSGTVKSKLEIWLQQELVEKYPEIDFQFNQKEAINSELDIYVQELKLAFELNGIFHYEPIFGDKKFNQIQNNDQRKFQACLERGIELCIIDTSQQKRFKPETSKKYLDIIVSIIGQKNQI